MGPRIPLTPSECAEALNKHLPHAQIEENRIKKNGLITREDVRREFGITRDIRSREFTTFCESDGWIAFSYASFRERKISDFRDILYSLNLVHKYEVEVRQNPVNSIVGIRCATGKIFLLTTRGITTSDDVNPLRIRLLRALGKTHTSYHEKQLADEDMIMIVKHLLKEGFRVKAANVRVPYADVSIKSDLADVLSLETVKDTESQILFEQKVRGGKWNRIEIEIDERAGFGFQVSFSKNRSAGSRWDYVSLKPRRYKDRMSLQKAIGIFRRMEDVLSMTARREQTELLDFT